jgi:peptidoglycan hydrolase-like protein with peptidoglycan-binding domain
MARSSWVEPDRAGPRPRPDRPATPHVTAAQPGPALVPAHLADLQRLAGNRAVARLQRQGGGTATAHRTVRAGSTGADVEELQTKLNAALPGAEPLVIDGIFGPRTRAAVVAFQGGHALAADGVAGPITWGALDSGGTTPPPPPPPPPPPGLATLRPGSTGADVAAAQQKLNAAGLGIAVLAIDGVYDRTTALVVLTFPLTHGITPTGILDPASRVALDAAVPGGGHDAAGIENAVANPRGAHPLGTQVPGTSLHPVVGPAPNVASGPAVREAQQKLNIWNLTQPTPATPLAEDSTWTAADTALLTTFQSTHGLTVGPLNAACWTALDAAAPEATSGFEQREWTEIVGGHQYQMTGTSASRYSWSLDPAGSTGNVMNVTARVNFTGQPPSGAWTGFVQAKWNRFAAQNAANEKVNIDFHLVSGSGPDAHDVLVKTGTGRANAGTWFLGDTHAADTVPHEFGHLIGLSDEYQLHSGDYRTVTGHEPTVGDAAGPAGVTAAQMAQHIQTQMITLSAANVAAVSTGVGLRSGAYAQQVLEAYAALPAVTLPAIAPVAPTGTSPGDPGRAAMQTTGRLVEDLDVGLRDDASGNRYEVIQALTYSSGSLMGDPGRVTDHDHGGAQARHVQEFCDHIARIRGGAWAVVNR